VGGAVSGVICVGSSLIFDGQLPTSGKLAGAVTAGAVSGAIVAGCGSGDPTFIGAVTIGAAAGGVGAVAGSVIEQGIDYGKVDTGKVIHDGINGAAGGLLGAGLGKAIGGSLGNGALSVPTGMAPAVNLNGTLTYVLTHTDIQKKAIVMAGVMAAANQLTAQAARGLAMAVHGGLNGQDPATEMAAMEAAAVERPDRLTRPITPTSLPPEVTDELPIGQMRTPGWVKQARNFFKRYRDAAKKWWEQRTGRDWPADATHMEHPRPIGNGGDPLFIEPGYDGPTAPHMTPGPDGLTDFQRWGRRGGRPPKHN
jgi:hypothetical protein